MASKTLIVLEDDLDGSEAAETVQFAIDGVTYEIDLSTQNAEKLRAGVEPFAEKARRVGVPLRSRGSRGGRGTKRTNGDAPIDTRAVRAWAASNGVQVSKRGRIPASVLQQYRAAGN
jgi:hypothetical protein